MTRKLDDLDPRFKLKVFEFISRCAEEGVPLFVVDTLRTEAEQEENLRKGVSWTRSSKHLPHPPDGKSYAIDVCPYSIFNLHGPDKLQWDAEDPIWGKIGAIGESLGLYWGGKWPQRDMGHFQFTP